MVRKRFTTSIDSEISNEFKKICDQANLDMNEVIEVFMKEIIDGKYKVVKEVHLISAPEE